MEKTALREPSSKTITALVVDDERATLMLHRALLAGQGIQAQVAENGKATKELRSMGICCLIAGVSGGSTEQQKQEFMEAGLDDYLDKPLNAAKLSSILHKLKNDG
ncbi:hypothetical protein FH972_017722 [Carpinus fangiana]|uniref:Response regulatory domain-containing protein n=1 Tax=Carpinus fangiana TaxID=176857 RepID=A0A5N6RKA6_9ROSI|nr:hypothetical protein FH972_017722 [Carpinus fangiana]